MKTANNVDQTGIRQLEETWKSPSGIKGFFKTVNHTNIGRRYMITAFIFFLAAGILALLMRLQLAFPENTFLDAQLYNQVFTMHGTTMMFLFLIPLVEGLGIYFVPLMIGTRDLSFPRLSAFSYYVFLIGGLALWIAFFFGHSPDAGWFNYVPLANSQFSPGYGIDIYSTAVTFVEISALAAAVELIASILKLRAPGMSLHNIPVFVWSILVVAVMVVFAMPGVIVASLMIALDRLFDTAFFAVNLGGDALLWQHLFWWFGHPDVYIAFLPAAGVVSTILPTMTKQPLYGYQIVVVSMIATGLVSFGLWIHHMFTTGLPVHASSFFTASSALIAVPTSLQIFCWLRTLWLGKIKFHTPSLFCLGFLFTFLIGGITGIMVSIIPFNKQVHDSYFVVAHFHYVLIGGVLFPFIAGLFYWWPKVVGRRLSESFGKISFWLIFLGFHITFFPMHLLGFKGMPRRVYTYLNDLGWTEINQIVSLGAALFAIGVLILLAAIIKSFYSPPLKKDPWNGGTLEWSFTGKPPSYNFSVIPYVSNLYPMWIEKKLSPAIKGLNPLRREIIVTTAENAEVQGVSILPGPTIWPFLVACIVGIGFIGSVFNTWSFVIAFFLAFIGICAWLWPSSPWSKTSVPVTKNNILEDPYEY
jgi:cytochrome c oxidase subunit 1